MQENRNILHINGICGEIALDLQHKRWVRLKFISFLTE